MEKRQAAKRRKLVIAGTGSGVGKTTVTLGIMAALRRRGLIVQGFKCGPDYIDPTYHKAVTSRPSRNLDSWMMGPEAVREIFDRASGDADISIIEGVMGFYDGKDPKSNTGSTAEISILLATPVLLVVNCQSMARSAAAIVKGFQLLDPRVKIAAVFANNVGSLNHYRIVKEAIEKECRVPVIGYMLRSEELSMPERHLGLVPSIERGDLDGFYAALADRIESGVDLSRLLELTGPREEPTGEQLTGEQPTDDEGRHKPAAAPEPAPGFAEPATLSGETTGEPDAADAALSPGRYQPAARMGRALLFAEPDRRFKSGSCCREGRRFSFLL
ncbi:cobyrinic acid a,c-diamide synthase [Paenibacillus sp. UNCCL117]|nr:cobyrinic acid a,c-diamide synthase [Paenibacillus sp. cl123]SFW69197.1 cobyrinic acid a,c-diamide synthase [Paenibacillus sp. UNCCL117]